MGEEGRLEEVGDTSSPPTKSPKGFLFLFPHIPKEKEASCFSRHSLIIHTFSWETAANVAVSIQNVALAPFLKRIDIMFNNDANHPSCGCWVLRRDLITVS